MTCSCLHGPVPPSRHRTQGQGGQLARHAAHRNGGALLLVVVCFPLGFHLLPFPQPWTGRIWEALCLGRVTATEMKGMGLYKEPSASQGVAGCVLCLHAGCLRPAQCGVCPQDVPGHRRHRLAPWLRLCELPGEGSADEAPVCGGKRGSVFTILPPAWTPGQSPARPCLCCPGLSLPQDRQGQHLTGQARGPALVPGSWQGPRLTSARS